VNGQGKHASVEPVLSVIVPCRGHARELRRCLAALHAQSCGVPHEIVVVDSAADPDVAAAAADHPDVRRVSDSSGLRPGGARNLGAREASGRLLAFLDADCVALPGWLEAVSTALSAEGTVAVGGPVLDALPRRLVAVADNMLQFTDFSPGRPDGVATHLPSCNLGIRREAYLELGGMTADYPVCEDGLFSTAAASRWPEGLRFVRGMRVRHEGRSTLRSFLAHQRLFGFYRGSVGSRLRRPIYRRWGRWRIFAVPIVCVRLGYVLRRTARWNPGQLMRLPALLPILLAGLVVWAGAFRRGCLEAREHVG